MLSNTKPVHKSTAEKKKPCTKIWKTADLVTFTEEILNEKLHFLCGEKEKKKDNCKVFCVTRKRRKC